MRETAIRLFTSRVNTKERRSKQLIPLAANADVSSATKTANYNTADLPYEKGEFYASLFKIL